MLIGIDAGAIAITDERLKVGVYRVTLELIKQLSTLDKANTYRLYSFQPIEKSLMDTFGTNMENVVLSPSTGYFSLRLPLEILIHPIDMFLGVSQAVPVMTKGCSVGFIHDLGFVHKPSLYGDSARTLTKQTKGLVARSDRIIAVSQTVKDDIKTIYRIDEKKISVCHEGVSSAFSVNGPIKSSKYPYFLFVGSMRKGKNIPTLLSHFQKFLSRSDKTYDLYLIGGDFWHDPEIEKTIGLLHLEDRVKRTGYVSDEELSSYYRGAVSFVTTSSWEGFCLPAVEAMASGCPVIAHDTGAIAEIVGKGGILVSPSDENGFVQAMVGLTGNQQMRNAYCEAAKRQVKQYNWTTFAKSVLQIIHANLK